MLFTGSAYSSNLKMLITLLLTSVPTNSARRLALMMTTMSSMMLSSVITWLMRQPAATQYQYVVFHLHRLVEQALQLMLHSFLGGMEPASHPARLLPSSVFPFLALGFPTSRPGHLSCKLWSISCCAGLNEVMDQPCKDVQYIRHSCYSLCSIRLVRMRNSKQIAQQAFSSWQIICQALIAVGQQNHFYPQTDVWVA